MKVLAELKVEYFSFPSLQPSSRVRQCCERVVQQSERSRKASPARGLFAVGRYCPFLVALIADIKAVDACANKALTRP